MGLPLGDFQRKTGTSGLITVGCATDNQGNSYLVDRLMTTKYPLGVILVELCHQLSLRHAALRAHWVPRDQNVEADSLTNSDFRHLSASKASRSNWKTSLSACYTASWKRERLL